MFGFLRLNTCGLEPEDRRLYRAHFCSVCHNMRSFGGLRSSLLTNYDITVWFLVAAAFDQPEPALERRPCTALPFQKVNVAPVSSRLGETMAALNLALVGAKLEDNLEDGEKAVARAGLALLGAALKKAHTQLVAVGFPLEQLTQLTRRQAAVEASPVDLASLAAPTRQLTAASFAFIADLFDQPQARQGLTDFGSHLGGFVYLWDALEDLDKDDKKGHFNAISSVLERDFRTVRVLLLHHLSELEKAAKSLELGSRQPLIDRLLKSLRGRVRQHTRLELLAAPALARERRTALARAGYVRAECDDGCCCSGCDGDCCCGGGGSDCCDASCCGSGGSDCCDLSCCGGGGGSDCCNISCCGCDGGQGDCCHWNCCDGCGSEGGGCCDCCDCCDCCCCCADENGRVGDIGFCCVDTGPNPSNTQSRPSLTAPEAPRRRRRGSFTRNLATRLGLVRVKGKGANCPGCGQTMQLLDVSGIEIDECTRCGGVWLDDHELDALSELPEVPARLLETKKASEFTRGIPENQRLCPRCRQRLELLDFDSLKLDICRQCKGTYLDHGELAAILRRAGARAAAPPQEANAKTCPYCRTTNEAGLANCKSCGAPLPG
ncbi:MAG: DUF5685 family protein [Vulcanimicrobiota bacterium]